MFEKSLGANFSRKILKQLSYLGTPPVQPPDGKDYRKDLSAKSLRTSLVSSWLNSFLKQLSKGILTLQIQKTQLRSSKCTLDNQIWVFCNYLNCKNVWWFDLQFQELEHEKLSERHWKTLETGFTRQKRPAVFVSMGKLRFHGFTSEALPVEAFAPSWRQRKWSGDQLWPVVKSLSLINNFAVFEFFNLWTYQRTSIKVIIENLKTWLKTWRILPQYDHEISQDVTRLSKMSQNSETLMLRLKTSCCVLTVNARARAGGVLPISKATKRSPQLDLER